MVHAKILGFLTLYLLPTTWILAMDIESTAFQNMQLIPKQYTCEGKNTPPPLQFGNIPAITKSLALIVEDPDTAQGTFDHWVVWNLPATVTALNENTSLPRQGKNGQQENKYKGPCPPPGKPHRYFFKLYALDVMLDLAEGSSKKDLEKAMQGHIVDQAQIIGLFERK